MQKHRTAFPENKKKPSVQKNIDQVLNQCQVKMKEMITQKQEITSKTRILINQQTTLKDEITHIKKKNEEKDNQIQKNEEEIKHLKGEIKDLKQKFEDKIQEIKSKEEQFRDGKNKINSDLASIEYGTLAEYSIKKAELKKKIEELVKEKEENQRLQEKLFNLTHDLAIYEVNILYNLFRMNMELALMKMKRMLKGLSKVLKYYKKCIASSKRKVILIIKKKERRRKPKKKWMKKNPILRMQLLL